MTEGESVSFPRSSKMGSNTDAHLLNLILGQVVGGVIIFTRFVYVGGGVNEITIDNDI